MEENEEMPGDVHGKAVCCLCPSCLEIGRKEVYAMRFFIIWLFFSLLPGFTKTQANAADHNLNCGVNLCPKLCVFHFNQIGFHGKVISNCICMWNSFSLDFLAFYTLCSLFSQACYNILLKNKEKKYVYLICFISAEKDVFTVGSHTGFFSIFSGTYTELCAVGVNMGPEGEFH